MSEKNLKELNDEDLEKVTGGAKGWYEGDPTLSNQITFEQAKQHIGEDLFFAGSSTWIYGTLYAVTEKNVYTDTRYNFYHVTIKKTNNNNALYRIGNDFDAPEIQYNCFLNGTFQK